MRFVLASGNAHKLGEFRAILAPHEVEAMPAGVELPPEGTESFAVNARAKAVALARALTADFRESAADAFVIADDSGLEVDALGGAPGVISSRYAGVEGDDGANNARLLTELEAFPDPAARRARFVCALACVVPEGLEVEVRGEWPGVIAPAPRGAGGFGYDPLLVPGGGTRSVAELTDDEKNAASHRARAGRALLAALAALGHLS
jgi:XTP/dITP diphosphohydrolase